MDRPASPTEQVIAADMMRIATSLEEIARCLGVTTRQLERTQDIDREGENTWQPTSDS